jgi:hypothetical protein
MGDENAESGNQPPKTTTDIATVRLSINDHLVTAVIDTGATGCLISNKFLKVLGKEPDTSSNINIIGINGQLTRPIGIAFNVRISHKKQELGTTKMQVMEADNYEVILGGDWLRNQKATID